MTDSNTRLEQLKSRLIETEILAQVGLGFINSQCLDYVKTLVKDFYRVTDSGEFETTDRTPLNPDLKPMPIENLGGWLHEVHPYLFKSETAGVSNAVTVAAPPPALNRAQMSIAEKADYIHKHGETAYLTLPATAAETLPLAERPRSTWSVEEKAEFVRRHGSEEYFKIPA